VVRDEDPQARTMSDFLREHLNRLRKGYAEKELEYWLSDDRPYSKTTRKIGKGRMFYDPIYFVKKVAKLRSFRLPIWAFIAPLTPEKSTVGAIYWAVDNPNGRDEIWLTRTTFGYGGTGPHQSAVILEFFEKRGIPIEARTGDYLLRFLGG